MKEGQKGEVGQCPSRRDASGKKILLVCSMHLKLVRLAVPGRAGPVRRAGRHLARASQDSALACGSTRNCSSGRSPLTRCPRRCSRHSTRPSALTCRIQ